MRSDALLISDAWHARGAKDLRISQGETVEFLMDVMPATPLSLCETIELSVAREAISRGIIIGKEIP